MVKLTAEERDALHRAHKDSVKIIGRFVRTNPPARPAMVTDAPRTTIFGEGQPERIWLSGERHSGEISWSGEPWPEEDSDEYEAVEYVRADLAMHQVAMNGDVEKQLWQRFEQILNAAGVDHVADIDELADKLVAASLMGSRI